MDILWCILIFWLVGVVTFRQRTIANVKTFIIFLFYSMKFYCLEYWCQPFLFCKRKCGSSRCFIIQLCRTELRLEAMPILLASHRTIKTYSFQKSMFISKSLYTMK